MASITSSLPSPSSSTGGMNYSNTAEEVYPVQISEESTVTAATTPIELTSTSQTNVQLDIPEDPIHQLPHNADDERNPKKLTIQTTVGSISPSSLADEKSQASADATKQSSHTWAKSISSFNISWPKSRAHRNTAATNNHTQWGIHWYSPTCMVVLTLVGIGVMVGHHLYNAKLHGYLVHDPQWLQRWGLALSTFGKMCLAGAVEIAYKQRVWVTVKKRPFRLSTIDGIFMACTDPSGFLNFDLITKATILTLLASLVWALPLSVIVSPATLTSITRLQNTSTICNGIQIIEFTHDDSVSISAPTDSATVNDGREGMAYINDMPSNASIAYYDQPSMGLRRISTRSLLSNFGPLQATNPCLGGANCSYQISFKGPSYDCADASTLSNYTNLAKSQLAPNGQAVYTSFTDVEEDQWGAPVEWQYMTADNDSTIGIFTQEPSLWIGYIINTTNPIEPFNNSSPWPYELEQHVLQCILQNSTYEYNISFINGLMQIDLSRVSKQIPLLPAGATQHPLDDNYGDFMGYHAAGFIFRNMLSGTVNQTNYTQWTRSYSSISQTPLLDGVSQYVVDNFSGAVEQQFATQILSLSTAPVLYDQVNITAVGIRV
ncbi:uncharacterized protein LY89DRAFT_734971 [Mollisia scopiformis]|uniref:Uncharacterized protein n=1 Tax=Mollisia scopiformis TaxID=149040 RepID=A0A194X7P1_MOLSC|nr:uncharacterized protein LY89DRAFT_734971 [Mollisia scopiformis]KUJ15822.1 hypothetical protein LY89DRAFT_734971 [Mollisia scopiformis]